MIISLGTRLAGRYKILSLLSGSGLSDRYLAFDSRLQVNVMVEVLQGDPQTLESFNLAAHLNHPNITRIFDVGKEQDVPFIVMEYSEGETLRSRMGRSLLPITEAIDIATQVAAALSGAHAAGIIHRDIKPENIMYQADGHVKVIDFGLARRNESDEEGVTAGTLRYMPPEVLLGQRVGASSDIWSLGVVLYEMITGDLPFPGNRPIDTVTQILSATPRPMKFFRSDAPAGLERVIGKALASDPQERYQRADDFSNDLQRIRASLETKESLASARLGVSSRPSAVEALTWPRSITGRDPWVALLDRLKRHRRFFVASTFTSIIAIVLALSLGQCRPKPKIPNRDAALRLQIGRTADSALNTMLVRFDSIEPVSVQLQNSKASTLGYYAPDVTETIKLGKVKLTEGLSDEDLMGLRDYVTQVYPTPKDEALTKIAAQSGRIVISRESGDEALRTAAQFISRIRSLAEPDRLSLNLRVNSQPERATYDMWPSGGPHRTTTTNNTVDNIYRGIYYYKVTKPGYKSVEQMLNLVDDDGEKLDCGLNKTEEQDGPHPCQLR